MTNDTGVLPQDEFSRQLDKLRGLSTVAKSQVETVTFYGHSETWLVETHRVPDGGDWQFVQRIGQGPNGPEALRLVFPPKVTEAMGRHREALSAKSRSKAAKQAARARAALGMNPTHLQDPKVRAKAVKARKAKAAQRRARRSARKAASV